MDLIRFFWPMWAEYVLCGILSYDEAVEDIILVAYGPYKEEC